MDIKIPFLAEGVETGTVVSILVAEGGKVRKDQTLLELETNKATAPIPSPVAGTISKILVQEGDEVSVGQAVIRLREEGTSQGKPSKEKTAPSQEPKRTVSQEKPATQSEGYQYQSKSGLPPPASPSVRKMAVDLGIDLARVRGTERGGRISVNDLKAYIQSLEHVAPRASQKAAPSAPSIDFSKWGPVSRQAISSIRRTIGQKMYESWTTIPHVTQFAEADITSLLALRKKFAPFYEKKGARLTVTGIILKAVVEVLKKYPKFNASLDEAKNDLVLKNYYHLGVAVDTEQGLLVPVLKEVDQKSILEISIQLAELAEKTRQRKISLEEVQGGTFTISNLGSIGGSFFTPIVNKPEVAILGIGQGVLKPVVKSRKTQVSTMLPLCLSYDHRVIDGADGARFIRELVRVLEEFQEAQLMIQESTRKMTRKKSK